MSERLFNAIGRRLLKWEIRGKQAWESYMDRGGFRSTLPIDEWRQPLTTWSRSHDRHRHFVAACMGQAPEGVVASTVIELGPKAKPQRGRRAA